MNTDPESVFEDFRNALREALKDNPNGDFGAEAAVEAFNECLELAKLDRTGERAMASAAYRTITEDDVGKPLFLAFGHHWPVANFLGHIMESDVGKRVFLRNDTLQVENDEQRDARLAKT